MQLETSATRRSPISSFSLSRYGWGFSVIRGGCFSRGGCLISELTPSPSHVFCTLFLCSTGTQQALLIVRLFVCFPHFLYRFIFSLHISLSVFNRQQVDSGTNVQCSCLYLTDGRMVYHIRSAEIDNDNYLLEKKPEVTWITAMRENLCVPWEYFSIAPSHPVSSWGEGSSQILVYIITAVPVCAMCVL